MQPVFTEPETLGGVLGGKSRQLINGLNKIGDQSALLQLFFGEFYKC